MLTHVIVFLLAAVIAVPLFKYFGLGSVLGYLAAGVMIGPWGLGLIEDVSSTLHLAELGVVLLLFIIGLELKPSRLWALRRSIFGLGSMQLILTGLLLGGIAYASGLPIGAAVLVGLALSLSSTAFALQLIAERNELTTKRGRSAFAILLFQDLAVVPLLAIVPLLGSRAAGTGIPVESIFRAIAMLVLVIVVGRYLLRYVLRIVALSQVREILTATALLTVLGAGYLLEQAGLSMALGAFLAGVLLADSEFRHQLEADIEPFKGLLLGLFFIAVGMSINVGLIGHEPVTVIAAALILVTVKFTALFVLGKWNGLDTASARGLGLTLSQGGEFAFVLLGVAAGAEVLNTNTAELLIVVVSLSMALTPLLLLADRQFGREKAPKPEYDSVPDENNPVIIAGFGRFGQITARVLRARHLGFTALEISQEQVDFVRRYGNQIYYGDASRLDLLHAAGAHKARIFVLAIDDVEASLRTAQIVLQHFPNLTIYARARNRHHAYQLMDLGISIIHRETFLSALDLTTEVLKGLGFSDLAARDTVERFKQHDIQRLNEHGHLHSDEKKMATLAKAAAQELEELFERDAQERGDAQR